MTFRHTLALSFAALIAAGFAANTQAATARRHTMTHGTHTVAGHTHARTTAPATGPDHSADTLNAQSLSRAQGATQ